MALVVWLFYGLGGKYKGGGKFFYVNSIACVRVGTSMIDWFDWFPVEVRLCQGCVMLPGLLDV